MAEENKNLELSFFGEEKRFQIRRVWHSEKKEWLYSITVSRPESSVLSSRG